jgi:pyruvate/2-oxoglutarate dehydrogenase complex dihydrolipoamide acyltransferase (E2) component
LTLEAMKTETAIESPVEGEVVEVLVGAGDQVSSGSALVIVASAEDSPGGSPSVRELAQGLARTAGDRS